MERPKLAVETRNLTKRFGGLLAINKLSFQVEEGELRCIIGPNGAGKTTLFNLLTGSIEPTSGDVYFQGVKITGLGPHQISQMGVGRKFQVATIFQELTVADNIRVAAEGKSGLLRLALHEHNEAFEEELPGLLERIRLYDKKDVRASTLSHGEQQWLEIGMVLASRPSLLLFDEPTAGMTMTETKETGGLIREIASGITTIVIEHDIGFVRGITKKITVMHRGAILAEGSLDEIERNEVVRDVYLGRQEK